VEDEQESAGDREAESARRWTVVKSEAREEDGAKGERRATEDVVMRRLKEASPGEADEKVERQLTPSRLDL
jgi:hypothetical protein